MIIRSLFVVIFLTGTLNAQIFDNTVVVSANHWASDKGADPLAYGNASGF